MSAEQTNTEQRRWAVTVVYTTEETYYVDADDVDEAEDKALDECGEADSEVTRCHQIAGPPPVEPATPTGTVTLLDGRPLILPCSEERGWFRLSGGEGDWWCNWWLAVRAVGVEGYVRPAPKSISISNILPRSAVPGRLVAEHRRFAADSGKEYVDLLDEGKEVAVRVDAAYWPLVHDPATGLEPRIVEDLGPVYGIRDNAIVAVVMPVRQ